MLHIGITGGIGSGKTTACQIFTQLGIPIYDSDSEAKNLVAFTLKEPISNAFGADIYAKGRLNKELLAERAFINKEATDLLNSIVHPAVGEHYLAWRQLQKAPYTVKEAALLIEAGSYKTLDKLIVVIAPEPVRIDRVIKRSKITKEEVKARIDKQLSDKQRLSFADYIIDNSGEQSLIRQVLCIHQQIANLENEAV